MRSKSESFVISPPYPPDLVAGTNYSDYSPESELCDQCQAVGKWVGHPTSPQGFRRLG